MNRFIQLFIAISFLAGNAAAEEMSVTPGSLARTDAATLAKIVDLTLTGEIDATDIMALRDKCEALRTLDLSGTKITTGAPQKQPNGADEAKPANILPEGAFFGSGITEVKLPGGVTEIGNFAFANTAITSIAIPATVTRIGDCAFAGSALKTIVVPATVEDFGEYVFARCEGLEEATLTPKTSTVLPEGTFMGCTSLKKLITSGIRTLGTLSLSGTKSLETFTHSTLDRVDDRALESSGLKELEAKWVKSTGDYAFAFMPALERLEISGYATEYGKGALAGCPLLSNHTPDDKADMPALIYAASPKVDFSTIEIKTPTIGEYAMLNNQSKTLKLGASVKSIADGALSGMTALTKIDATELYDTPPAATDASFAGIDRSKVELLVGEHTASVWKKADGWKSFNIQELSGIDNPTADPAADGGITFRFDNGILYVAAPIELKNIEVYDTAGIRLFSATPGATEYTADLSHVSEPVVILRIKTAEATRTAKLYR